MTVQHRRSVVAGQHEARPTIRDLEGIERSMQFIEMSGRTLLKVIDNGELGPDQLQAAGLGEDSIVRVNLQGDIELRRRDRWDVIGGLLGDYDHRVRAATGLDWM